MRASSLFRPATAGVSFLTIWPLLAIWHSATVDAFTPIPVSQPALDLSPLGRIALAGNFDAISIYSYQQQAETLPASNGSQSLLTQLPNGVLATLSSTDAEILAMCPWTLKNGSFAGLIIGGNFTSVGGMKAQGIASYDPNTNQVQNIPGLSGTVRALVCDQPSDSVYVGGDFTVGNSSNAMVWNGSSGWSALPFGGFNGPVSSIVKADNGHFIYGGTFDGLGNQSTPQQRDSQIINLSTANISSDAQSTQTGFTDPRNIICKTSGHDGAGNTWLLADYSPGFWRADMQFGFRPTKLRLYNTHFQGRGTKTFRYQELPDTGILNLTYTDPQTGHKVFCDSECPLSNNASETFRDFEFVNPVGMSGFMLQISDWYGQGAGLDGVELYEDEIFAYAINNFNEPTCAGVTLPSMSNTTGQWTVTAANQTPAEYLTADVSNDTSASVTFAPDIKQSGNYSVLLYTPGCVPDGTCQSRGIVNVTATFASSTHQTEPLRTLIWQTNDFEKYDTIYTGYIEARSDQFRPTVTVFPLGGQGNLKIVASRVYFQLINSTGGLNGLYDYDPTQTTVNTDFSTSNVDSIGTQLDHGATISSLVSHNGTIFAAGNFSGSSLHNILSFSNGNATSLSGTGLNSVVQSLLVLNDTLYAGGNFTNTAQAGARNLSYVAAYSLADNTWSPLGAGVNGPVTSVLSLPVNTSAGTTETTVAVSGRFDQVLGFGSNSSVSVSGFAVWVPSQKNWLQNLNGYPTAFNGQLTATANVGNNTTILAGSLISDGLAASGGVFMTDSKQIALEPMPIDIQMSGSNTGSLSKRDLTSRDFTGLAVVTFDRTQGRNVTILGGHFSAKATNGSTIQNLLFLNGSNSDTVTGIGSGVDSNSTFTTLAVQNDTLFAAGTVTGTVGTALLNGFVAYDLATATFVSPQPPGLTGPNVSVEAVTVRPSSTEVFFGGVFDAAGALPCPAVCIFDTSSSQWTRPGAISQGSVSSLQWASNTKLVAAGNLTVGNNQTMLATYDTNQQMWAALDGASPSDIPGPVTAFGPAAQDLSVFWIAGQGSNGSAYVMKYDGSAFHSAGNLFEQSTTILGLQVMGLSKVHSSTGLLNQDQVLIITGQLVIPNFGNASAAIYNGTAVAPFLLSSTGNGQAGMIRQVYTENQNTFSGTKSHLSTGLVVLISFCIALGCVFLIVVFGIILNKIQRRRQGYVRAPTTYQTDRPTSMRRVPPEYLFDSLRQRNSGVPTL